MSLKLPPLCHELPYLSDSSHYFENLRSLSWPVFLDSTQHTSYNNRYDIIAAEPFITVSTTGELTTVTDDTGQQIQSKEDPFTIIQQQLAHFPKQDVTDLPFCGGAIGLFCYDLGRRIEILPELAQNQEQMPDMLVGIYDWVVLTDHELQRSWLVSYGIQPQTQQQWPSLIEQLTSQTQNESTNFIVGDELTSSLNRKQYNHAFNKIQHYIHEGDCYQVNLAKRFAITAEGDPWFAYKQLRQRNSAPFSAFFAPTGVTILSSSPERLLSVHNGHVETKPIKGTRRRDLDDHEADRALADELQNSVKDRAENLMIVDLLRNDLGKVCQPGSISVPKPFSLETFARVHHLVSTITGKLSEQFDAVSLLRACFPGGSITGAPKLRAMEIIEELEPDRRGAYCGSIAYIGFDGNMDSNILIRTLVYSDQHLRFWAGGGIVADSDVDAEYQEIHDKAAAILDLISSLRK